VRTGLRQEALAERTELSPTTMAALEHEGGAARCAQPRSAGAGCGAGADLRACAIDAARAGLGSDRPPP
jgi:hypothetical protein